MYELLHVERDKDNEGPLSDQKHVPRSGDRNHVRRGDQESCDGRHGKRGGDAVQRGSGLVARLIVVTGLPTRHGRPLGVSISNKQCFATNGLTTSLAELFAGSGLGPVQ